MIEMVSKVTLHKDIGEVTMLKRNEGVRCSKRVLDGMCLQMATTSTSSTSSATTPINNNHKIDSSFDENCIHSPEPSSSGFLAQNTIVHHPVTSIIGPLYAKDDFEVIKPLGEGFFSKVFKVKHISTGEVFVLKESKPTGGCRRQLHADAAREAAMMRRLNHENVLDLRGICISRDEDGKWDANLLVAYCEGGSLNNLVLDRQIQLSWNRRVRYARDISSAMEYLHEQGIIHRDLTSSNVLICSNNDKAVVADFGLSCPFPQRGEKLAQVGTTYFMSPECLNEEYYDEKSDIFSFGIILCQMIARVDVDPEDGIPRTSKFGFDYMLFTPLCPLDTPIELLKLAYNSCVMDPAARPSFAEAKNKLLEILATMPVGYGGKMVELLRDGKESRLGRSRSDAALKRPKSLATTARKLSTNFNPLNNNVRPVIEGEIAVDDSTAIATKLEELARDVARDEPEFHHINPFLDHERFRTERKIIPPKKVQHTPRRRSDETKTDGGDFSPVETSIDGTPRRRCLSMPCSINDTSNMEKYSSTSFNGNFLADETIEDLEYLDANNSPASGIPMAYRDFDRKFLKQMIRLPSRRYSMQHSDKSPVTSAVSSFELCPDRKFGLKEMEVDISPVIVPDEKKRKSVVVYNDPSMKNGQKRRFNRVCSSAQRNVHDCCIL